MKRWILALAATLAVFAATAATAFASDPVQSATQSSATDQAALAASSATQAQPSNENISVRVLSPGDDGSVSQSNEAASTATAANTASTAQTATQALAACGCAVAALDGLLPTAAPAPATGGGGVQSSQQGASTDQTAAAASSAAQLEPSNSNISVRVLSPGDDGSVSQSNTADSTAGAANTAATTQGSSQTGGGSGVQSSTQNADTAQKAAALSSATQVHPENSNVSVRVLSPGNGGSVSQSNEATSSADARNTAPVTQTASQSGAGASCGCGGGGTAVQAIGQSSDVGQIAAAASSAQQLGASNESDPVRIASGGNDGALHQSNDASSKASAANSAPVTQSGSQVETPGGCGCAGPSVQALGQSSEVGQLAAGFSSATQVGASNESAPVRIAGPATGGTVSQSNESESTASAANSAPTVQSGTQTQAGSGVQALGQKAETWQAALAASSALQLPARSECRCECGCGASFGNVSDPVRIGSGGGDGGVRQENEASSSADASNLAAPTQTATQTRQASRCGCAGTGVQALGQWATVDQLAAALSSARQAGAANGSGPVRIGSGGGAGTTWQANEAGSGASAPNVARILQAGTQVMA